MFIMAKKRINIWDILAWIVLLLILLWVILKVFGLINTPALLEYAPYFGAVYLAGWAMHKLDTATNEIKHLQNFAKETINEITKIKTNCIKNHNPDFL